MKILYVLLLTIFVGIVVSLCLLSFDEPPKDENFLLIDVPGPIDPGTPVIPQGILTIDNQGFQGLQSLEDHNKSILLYQQNLTECKTDIACPECGHPLFKNLTVVLTSNPCRYYVHCKNCKYTGTCF